MPKHLSDYSYFTNKDDMDEAAKQHISANWNEMNSTDRAVLDVIRCYSVKYGAAHLKHCTIENAVNKSNATVRRTIRKLEQLGIIDRVHFIRPVMSGLGANIYAIKPFKADEKSNEPDPIEKPSNKGPQREETKALIEEEQPKTLFGRIKSMLNSTIGEDSLARRIYGIYRYQSIQMLIFDIHADKGDLFKDLAIQALHIAVQSTKRKEIRNLPGYYTGILRELIDKALFSDSYTDYDIPVEGFFYK